MEEGGPALAVKILISRPTFNFQKHSETLLGTLNFYSIWEIMDIQRDFRLAIKTCFSFWEICDAVSAWDSSFILQEPLLKMTPNFLRFLKN